MYSLFLKQLVIRLSMTASFLWSGDLKSKFTAKVKWADVYQPKKEGGLGIKKIENGMYAKF